MESNNSSAKPETGNSGTFGAHVDFDQELHSTVITLSYRDRDDPSRNIVVGIAPDLGSNMFQLRVGGHDIIYCEPTLLKQRGFTGNFVLWPFPNRVRDKRYVYQGQTYSLEGLKRPGG